MLANCPDCCIEQMLAMRNEQYNNKGGSRKGSSSRKNRDHHQRKPSHGSNKNGMVSADSSSKNMPPISQLTIRTSDGGGGGDAASDCGSMGSSASEITYGTNGGRSNTSTGFNSGSGGSGNNEHPHVTRMPFTDAYGDKGWYTGEVASVSGLPHGKGTLNYCDGRIRAGFWSNGMAGGTSVPGAPPPPMRRVSNGSSAESPPTQPVQLWERRRPIVKTDMPWTDLIGESGLYTGEIDENGEPHGMGMMRYHDGSVLEGEWFHGELQRRRESGGGQDGNQGQVRSVATRF
ncbi:hypothetical protein ACHAXM_001207 [Skeletonema potamos]